MERHVLHASFRVRVRACVRPQLRSSGVKIDRFSASGGSLYSEEAWQRGRASVARSPAFTAHGGAVVSNSWGSIFG